MSGSFRIPIRLQDHDINSDFGRLLGVARTAWPVRFGVPFPPGALPDSARISLDDGAGPLPLQMQVTSRWPDRSVRWASLLALVDLKPSETKDLFLQITQKRTRARTAGLRIIETSRAFVLENKHLKLTVQRNLESFHIEWNRGVLAEEAPDFELVLADGKVCRPSWTSSRLETDGALRARILLEGRYLSADGAPSFDVTFGLELTSGQPWIECFHRLAHLLPGQPYLDVRSLAFRQAWCLGQTEYVVQQTHRGPLEWLPREVRQSGSVVVRVTDKRVLVEDLAMVRENAESYPPYLQKGLDDIEPWLALNDPTNSILFWTPEPNGHSPQIWRAGGREFQIQWIPADAAANPESLPRFSQGRAKTHRWRWHLATTSSLRPVDGTAPPQKRRTSPYHLLSLLHRLPPLVSVAPSWARRCKVMRLGQSLRSNPARFPRFEAMLDRLFDLKWPRGMMNWGDDIDAGYTQTHRETGRKLEGAVWTNNEYDFIYASLHQMLRADRPRLARVAERCAAHALDIDFVHFSDDSELHHGSPAHSVRHTTASSYPSHIWTEGLLHYYYMTGDRRAFDVAQKSGRFILRHMKQRPWVVEQSAREGSWALLALTELALATGEDGYLNACRKIAGSVLSKTDNQEIPYPGDASFFIGVLVMGLDKFHQISPDKRIPKAIDFIMQWRLKHRMTPEGIPLYHWNAAERMVNPRELLFPTALAIAYRHTPRKAYLAAIWRCLQYWLDTNIIYGSALSTKEAASFYRTWVEAFEILADEGLLSKLEYLK